MKDEEEAELRKRAFNEDGSRDAKYAQAMTAPHKRFVAENGARMAALAVWQEYFKTHYAFLMPTAFAAAFPHDHTTPSTKRQIDTDARGSTLHRPILLDVVRVVDRTAGHGCTRRANERTDRRWVSRLSGRISKTLQPSTSPGILRTYSGASSLHPVSELITDLGLLWELGSDRVPRPVSVVAAVVTCGRVGDRSAVAMRVFVVPGNTDSWTKSKMPAG